MDGLDVLMQQARWMLYSLNANPTEVHDSYSLGQYKGEEKVYRWILQEAEHIKKEMAAVALLREAGCNCPEPLLGHRPGVGPRCRLCGVVANELG